MSSTNSGVTSQSREAVVSAANLLLVSLLKLNRGFVPILLRWIRGRRTNWINRASDDVYKDLLAGTNTRHLCVRQCCSSTYSPGADQHHHDEEDFDDDDDDDDDDDEMEAEQNKAEDDSTSARTAERDTEQESGPSSPKGDDDNYDDDISPKKPRVISDATSAGSSVMTKQPDSRSTVIQIDPDQPGRIGFSSANENRTSRAPQSYGSSTPTAAPTVGISMPDHARSLVRQSLGLVVAEADEERGQYIKLLIAQEEKHRRQKVIPAVFQTVLTGWITVASLIIYSTVILVIVGVFFPMSAGTFMSFSFTLVATATVSEADKLMQVLKKRKAAASKTAPPTSQKIKAKKKIEGAKAGATAGAAAGAVAGAAAGAAASGGEPASTT